MGDRLNNVEVHYVCVCHQRQQSGDDGDAICTWPQCCPLTAKCGMGRAACCYTRLREGTPVHY